MTLTSACFAFSLHSPPKDPLRLSVQGLVSPNSREPALSCITSRGQGQAPTLQAPQAETSVPTKMLIKDITDSLSRSKTPKAERRTPHLEIPRVIPSTQVTQKLGRRGLTRRVALATTRPQTCAASISTGHPQRPASRSNQKASLSCPPPPGPLRHPAGFRSHRHSNARFKLEPEPRWRVGRERAGAAGPRTPGAAGPDSAAKQCD